MKLTQLVFEGSIEELREVRHLFEDSAGVRISPPEPGSLSDEEGGPSLELLRTVLARIEVSQAQRRLFQAVAAAGADGVSRLDLAAAIERTPSQLDGVLGALGHRVTKTPYPDAAKKGGITCFFVMWKANSQWHYRLRPVARQALEEAGLL